MPDLDQIIMVLDPLIIFTEQVLQMVSSLLLCVKTFIFNLLYELWFYANFSGQKPHTYCIAA